MENIQKLPTKPFQNIVKKKATFPHENNGDKDKQYEVKTTKKATLPQLKIQKEKDERSEVNTPKTEFRTRSTNIKASLVLF